MTVPCLPKEHQLKYSLRAPRRHQERKRDLQVMIGPFASRGILAWTCARPGPCPIPETDDVAMSTIPLAILR